MADQFGFTEGVKTLTGSLDASRESAKSLSKSIEGIQNDGLEVAQRKAQERSREKREAEVKQKAPNSGAFFMLLFPVQW